MSIAFEKYTDKVKLFYIKIASFNRRVLDYGFILDNDSGVFLIASHNKEHCQLKQLDYFEDCEIYYDVDSFNKRCEELCLSD